MFAPGVLQSFLSTMQVFYYGDAYPATPLGIRWVEWLVSEGMPLSQHMKLINCFRRWS
jgi:hypothetical protein